LQHDKINEEKLTGLVNETPEEPFITVYMHASVHCDQS